MKKTVHRSESRGFADHGWLQSRHTFSFASYYNPDMIRFGLLRVLNDDIVAGGKGFGTHPHDNMEIISIPIYGAIEHKDSMGNTSVIRAGEVQIMSAGTGITHSEYNHSPTEPVNFLQLWIFPKKKNAEPRYEQKILDLDKMYGSFLTIVSPDGSENSVHINQDAWLSMAEADAMQQLTYTQRFAGNGLYLFVIEGSVEAAEEVLHERDAVAVSDAESLTVKALSRTKLLMIELPMN